MNGLLSKIKIRSGGWVGGEADVCKLLVTRLSRDCLEFVPQEADHVIGLNDADHAVLRIHHG